MGIVKLRLMAVSDPQHGGVHGWLEPVSWGSIDELFVNLTVPSEPLRPARLGNLRRTALVHNSIEG